MLVKEFNSKMISKIAAFKFSNVNIALRFFSYRIIVAFSHYGKLFLIKI